MTMRLCFFFLSLVLSLARKDAMADDSLPYNPGNARPDNLQYCPTASASGQSISYAPQGALNKKITQVKDEAYKKAWSGTWKDLEAIVAKAEKMYGFENTKHLGRNASMLIPFDLSEMEREVKRGALKDFHTTGWDGGHAKDANSDDSDFWWMVKAIGSGVVKYVNGKTGAEAVYDKATGKCLTNTKLGTKNFGPNGLFSALFGKHQELDMATHKTKADPSDSFSKDGDQYKYVGILYKRDPNSPDKFYIIDGQTGLPMTPQQVAEMPTTLSDMWKDMGLVCVKNDAKDLVPSKDPLATSGLKRAEGCNACKCKHETANLKPQIWRNGLDEGYSIVILCAECMAVKYSVDVKDKKKVERKICSCASPDVFFAGVCRKKIGVLDKLWAQYYCRKCGGFRRGDMMDLIKTDKGVAVYPAGVVPSDWDGKVYEPSELDAHVRSMVK